MAGNVTEWVLDNYADDWYSTGGAICADCANLQDTGIWVTKGAGSPDSFADFIRPAERAGGYPTRARNDQGIGMRCARD